MAQYQARRVLNKTGSGDSFKAILGTVLAHLVRLPDASVHDHIDAGLNGLHRTDRAADVEHRIRALKPCRL
jgi:hypothetical protein